MSIDGDDLWLHAPPRAGLAARTAGGPRALSDARVSFAACQPCQPRRPRGRDSPQQRAAYFLKKHIPTPTGGPGDAHRRRLRARFRKKKENNLLRALVSRGLEVGEVGEVGKCMRTVTRRGKAMRADVA